MNIIVDLVIVIILVLAVWSGKKNGFIKSFFSLFGSIASFILSSLLARPVGAFLGEKFISPLMEKYLLNALSEHVGTAVESIDFSTLPPSCNEVLSSFGVSVDSLKEMLVGVSVGEDSLAKFSELVIHPVSNTIGYAAAYIVLFIVISIAIRIAVRALDLVSKLPILNFSNKTLGIVMGAVWGLFLALVFSGVISYMEPAIQGSENSLINAFDVEKTYLVRFFSQIDILNLFSAN